MATAKQPGGLYYVNGKAVNAEGALLGDAPPMPENTVVSAPVAAMTSADIDALVAKKAEEIADRIVTARLAELTAPSAGDAPKPDDTKPEKGK
jgi:hypothetical protein